MDRPRPSGDVAVPAGIDRLVQLAAGDRRFRVRLFADRLKAAKAAGVRLTDSERALLVAIPDEQLLAIIEAVPATRAARRTFLQSAAAWVCGLLGGVALTTTACPAPPTKGIRPGPTPAPMGSRPDVPAPPPPKPEEPKEAPSATGPDTGIRPDLPPKKGG